MNAQTIKKATIISDKDVIERVLNGDKDFYEILMRRCNELLYRVIRGYIKEDNVAEDLMQDTYILAYQKLGQFKGASAFSTWLVRIGINQALNYIRKSGRIAQVFPGEAREGNVSFQDKMHPEMKMIHSESGRDIEKAIDELPANLRTVFIMIEVEGLHIDEVSVCLELSTSNVKVRLHRAKKVLRKRLSQLSDLENLYAYGAKHCDALVSKVMSVIAETNC